MSTAYLCTHCHEFAAVPLHVGDATYCSLDCQRADQAATNTPGWSVGALPVRVLVAIVHNVGVVQTAAAKSLMALGWGNRIERAKAETGVAEITFAWFEKAPRVDTLRDRALFQAQRDGFTHVLFLDADMLHPDDLFHRILPRVRLDPPAVVSGFYTQRHFPFAPIAFRDGQLHESGLYMVYRHDAAYTDVDPETQLRPEDVIGMGCALIPLSILPLLGARPWFEYRNDEDGWPMVSEDVPFCEKVRAAGVRIFLDPAIQCGHLYTDVAHEGHWKRGSAVIAESERKLHECIEVSISAAEVGP